jgi:hypothetical protein
MKAMAYQITTAACLLSIGAVNAATPCDFKGLSVGDKATPQQIMRQFGITKYTTADPPQTDAQKKAAFDAQMKRAKEVSIMNAAEEQESEEGPACRENYCRLPYGYVTVGNEPHPIYVGAFVSFDSTGRVTEIDVTYDKSLWDEVLQLLNLKFDDNWQREDTQDVTTDYQTKKHERDTVTVLTHRTQGTNPKTRDKCAITATSRDIVWLHSMPPIYRAELVIKLISKNF